MKFEGAGKEKMWNKLAGRERDRTSAGTLRRYCTVTTGS